MYDRALTYRPRFMFITHSYTSRYFQFVVIIGMCAVWYLRTNELLKATPVQLNITNTYILKEEEILLQRIQEPASQLHEKEVELPIEETSQKYVDEQRIQDPVSQLHEKEVELPIEETSQKDVNEWVQTMKSHPILSKKDKIFKTDRLSFVIPEYKLIFFTFEKVASVEWLMMLMRMTGNPMWCKSRRPVGYNAFLWKNNKISRLRDFNLANATAMMTSPVWTRAAIFREPKARVLSAFLDKAVRNKSYVAFCCNKLPEEELKGQCIKHQTNFTSFLYFVTEYQECSNPHWAPQLGRIDTKWWPYIDVTGYHHNLYNDSKKILSRVTSPDGKSAWDKYGATGWKSSQPEKGKCEMRLHSFLKENTSGHQNVADSKLEKWYTPELERLVEDKFAIEWSNSKVNFPEIKLF